MYILLACFFFLLSFVNGLGTYVLKNTVGQWFVAMLSLCGSMLTAWCWVYLATRFFYEPSMFVTNLEFATLTIRTGETGGTIVLEGAALLLCCLPFTLAWLAIYKLRNIPEPTILH